MSPFLEFVEWPQTGLLPYLLLGWRCPPRPSTFPTLQTQESEASAHGRAEPSAAAGDAQRTLQRCGELQKPEPSPLTLASATFPLPRVTPSLRLH